LGHLGLSRDTFTLLLVVIVVVVIVVVEVVVVILVIVVREVVKSVITNIAMKKFEIIPKQFMVQIICR